MTNSKIGSGFRLGDKKNVRIVQPQPTKQKMYDKNGLVENEFDKKNREDASNCDYGMNEVHNF